MLFWALRVAFLGIKSKTQVVSFVCHVYYLMSILVYVLCIIKQKVIPQKLLWLIIKLYQASSTTIL